MSDRPIYAPPDRLGSLVRQRRRMPIPTNAGDRQYFRHGHAYPHMRDIISETLTLLLGTMLVLAVFCWVGILPTIRSPFGLLSGFSRYIPSASRYTPLGRTLQLSSARRFQAAIGVDYASIIDVPTSLLEDLSEHYVDGIELSLDAKEIELTIKSLATIVRGSDLEVKDMMVDILNRFAVDVQAVGRTLQRVSAEIGATIDIVTALNTHALRTIRSEEKYSPRVALPLPTALNTLEAQIGRVIVAADGVSVCLKRLEETLSLVYSPQDYSLGGCLWKLWALFGGKRQDKRTLLREVKNFGDFPEHRSGWRAIQPDSEQFVEEHLWKVDALFSVSLVIHPLEDYGGIRSKMIAQLVPTIALYTIIIIATSIFFFLKYFSLAPSGRKIGSPANVVLDQDLPLNDDTQRAIPAEPKSTVKVPTSLGLPGRHEETPVPARAHQFARFTTPSPRAKSRSQSVTSPNVIDETTTCDSNEAGSVLESASQARQPKPWVPPSSVLGGSRARSRTPAKSRAQTKAYTPASGSAVVLKADDEVQCGSPYRRRQRAIKKRAGAEGAVTTYWFEAAEIGDELIDAPPDLTDDSDLHLGDLFYHHTHSEYQLWLWTIGKDGKAAWEPVFYGYTREDGRHLIVTETMKFPSWVDKVPPS
ncbi:hypothetical protein C8Q79DRAFT_1012119 [Trametes meyenii]|nr:hypothetical protein C8Q79DRAFT_1012119 [Trametes meyenii]